jgi:PAS domain S-box-containing protein
MPDADSHLLSDPKRLEKLRALCLLDSPADPAFDRLTRLAARFLHAPVSLVSLVEADRQFFMSQQGLPNPWAEARETPLSHSFCQHVVTTQEPLIIEDAKTHPLVLDNLAIRDLNVTAYAGIPLVTSDGISLGSFCVIDHVPRVWTEEEISILHDLAASVMTEIELRGELIERRSVEAALRESHHLTEQIVNTVPDVVYIYDMQEQRNIYSNRELSGVLGYSVEDIRKLGTQMLNALMHPEDWHHFQEHIQRLSIVSDERLVEFQYRMRHVNGSWRWFHSREIVFKRDENNHPKQILGIAADVTEWVLTEQTIRENLDQLMLLRRIEAELSESLDLDQVLMTALDAALRLSGVEHATVNLIEGDEIYIAQSIGHYQMGKRYPISRGIVGRALRQGEPQLVMEVDKDPDYIPELPSTRAQMTIPLKYHERMIGVLNLETSKLERFRADSFTVLSLIAARMAAAMDFASLYQLSQRQLTELQKLYVRVSELEQLKTDMIRIAAHDLRNPLSAIVGFTELLQGSKDNLTGEQQEMITLMRRAGQQMQSIITNILSLQRIEQQGYNREKVDLAEVTQHAFEDSLNRAQMKSLDYSLEVPDEPLYVEGDNAQLCEAIDNLINNAIKYTPDGGKVQVKLSEKSGLVVFEVEDNGIGVPEDQQARLFQPFFRVNTVEVNKIEGTGLGLHLVRNIVERHGGRMRFESVYHQGSKFGFQLPERF